MANWYEEQAQWCRQQVDWYKQELERTDRDIEYLTRRIEEERKEDRELLEWIWGKGVVTRLEMELYGDPKNYIGPDTRDRINERRREYRRRKNCRAKIDYYGKKAETYERRA